MKIVPALLEENREIFEKKLDKLADFTTRVQVDFNDGTFENTKTLTPEEIAGAVLKRKNKLVLEAHLMVQKPYGYIPKLIKSGFKKIIIQYEIEGDIREILEQLRLEGVLVGLAIGPETGVTEIEPFGDLLDTVTVMTVEPGKQGQKFRPELLTKVTELRDGNFPGEIQVDGAIAAETIDAVVAVKPDTLVVGSYIVGSDDPRERYEFLESLV